MAESYSQTFNRLLENGTIVKRGLKADAKVFDELVFDVNTAYFDENGGYDFAKRFYEEAYRLAVKEVGSEEYILSAVMHADEKNIALSQELGRDVFHYHLHIVYVPVVQKEVLWTKRCKDPALVGTIKEVIPQISHSKKWPRFRDESGKWVNSYSLLQDRFFEHMKAAGFDGFERGERGSTAEHLDVLDYKIQQDTLRLEDLGQQAKKKKTEVENLTQATKARVDIAVSQAEIESMAKPGKTGRNKIVTNSDWAKVSEMAKRCLLLDTKLGDLQRQIAGLQRDRDKWKNNYTSLWNEVKDFIKAIRSIPNALREFIDRQRIRKEQTKEGR